MAEVAKSLKSSWPRVGTRDPTSFLTVMHALQCHNNRFESPRRLHQKNRAVVAHSTEGSQPLSSSAHVQRKVLGIDYGRKWTGIATGLGESCQPLKVIPSGDTSTLARLVLSMAKEQGLNEIVVGYPINPEVGNSLTNPSKDTPIARRCRNLANNLAILTRGKGSEDTASEVSIYLYDEFSTSADARLLMGSSLDSDTKRVGFQSTREKQQHKEDALAAMLLVRRYLNKPGLAVRVRLR
jgi:RNase H-fold protein (predicted Holliday junction resolvase)